MSRKLEIEKRKAAFLAQDQSAVDELQAEEAANQITQQSSGAVKAQQSSGAVTAASTSDKAMKPNAMAAAFCDESGYMKPQYATTVRQCKVTTLSSPLLC